MKRLTSILCSVAFMLGGFLIALTNDAFTIVSNAKTARAAPVPSYVVPMQYPRDLLLGHNNNVGTTIFRDTIHDTIPLEIQHDTVHVVKYKTKWRTKREIVPDTVSRQVPVDTLYVSKPVIIMPVVKEEAIDSINLNAQLVVLIFNPGEQLFCSPSVSYNRSHLPRYEIKLSLDSISYHPTKSLLIILFVFIELIVFHSQQYSGS